MFFECKVKYDYILFFIVLWLKDNRELFSDERFIVDKDYLVVVDVSDDDSGIYMCVVNIILDSVFVSVVFSVVDVLNFFFDLELID